MSRRKNRVGTGLNDAREFTGHLIGSVRMSRRKWWDIGGPANPNCWRRMVGRSWQYYYQLW